MTDLESIIRTVVREEIEAAFKRHCSRAPSAQVLRRTKPPAPLPPLPDHPQGPRPDLWLSEDAAAYLAAQEGAGSEANPMTPALVRQACEDGQLDGHWIEDEARWVVPASAVDRWLGPDWAWEPVMRVPEAAAYLGVTTGTLQRWRTAGRGPVFRHEGKLVVYRRSEIDEWQSEHAMTGRR